MNFLLLADHARPAVVWMVQRDVEQTLFEEHIQTIFLVLLRYN